MHPDPIWTGWILQQDGTYWGRWTVVFEHHLHRSPAVVPARADIVWKRCAKDNAERALRQYLTRGTWKIAEADAA